MTHMLLGGLVSLDLTTLLLCSGLVVAITGVIFVLGTVLQHNDLPSRLWSTAFILGILTMVSFAVWSVIPDALFMIGIGNGALVMCMGFLWSGSRAFNERRPLQLVSTAGGLLVTVLAWIDGGAGSWAGGQIFLLGVAVFALLAGIEPLTGRMRRNLNARIVSVVMFIVGIFFGLRSLVFATSGPYSPLFLNYFDTDITTFVTILLVITASTSMAVLRAEGSHSRASGSVEEGRWGRFASTELFATAANDRLERLEHTTESSTLMRIQIDKLSEMNTAFGGSFSDAAQKLVGSVLRDMSSASAVLGHSGTAGFDAVVFENLDQALERAQRIRSALVDTPVDASQGLRVSVTIALVVPEQGERFAALSERATQLVAEGIATGGNVIIGHPEEYSRA